MTNQMSQEVKKKLRLLHKDIQTAYSLPGLRKENPHDVYYMNVDVDHEGEFLGVGKFARVVKAVHKETGEQYAAKCIRFENDTMKFPLREYAMMAKERISIGKATKPADFSNWPSHHESIVNFKEAFLVQKYLIIIMDLVEGETITEYAAGRAEADAWTENDVAIIIRGLCNVLQVIHENNFTHLDIRPTNIRLQGNEKHKLKLLDYNSGRQIANKNAGEVVDTIGDTEFCPPEMLEFENVQPGSDMWSVGVIMYILMCGESPFYHEEEKEVVKCVRDVKPKDFTAEFTPEARDFIKTCWIRIPSSRLSAKKALDHIWLSDDMAPRRKANKLNIGECLRQTDERLLEEEKEEYVDEAYVFRTYEEEEFKSPLVSDDDDDE